MADPITQMLSQKIADSRVRGDLSESRLETATARGGPQRYALSIATVMTVDYERMEASLRIESGETFHRSPIPITFPGAGARHFLGALPEPGDVCVIGWGSQESGRSERPFILAWIIPGVTAGHDWLPTQPFAPDELGSSPKHRLYLEGVASRRRHKMRHMEPGNVFGSSSQGSDILLNESVLLTNRRGAEIRLEDRDNSLIVRSLQQFHAGGGFRIYAGNVQRDAGFLPTQLFSDGTNWAAARQVDEAGRVIPADELAASDFRAGRLTPAGVFQRDNEGNALVDGLFMAGTVDPYDVLRRGLFISDAGVLIGNPHSDAIYGGKHIYRVSVDGANGAVDTEAEVLTEWRLEVSHTNDGTLPVTEQTDGFDADRLSSSATTGPDALGNSPNAAYMSVVFGSVVGNDRFTRTGRNLYGLPLKPVVFDGNVRSPAMVSGIGSSVETHAGFLLEVRPPFAGSRPPSFLTFTKDGRLMGSIAGPGKRWSGELAFGSGLRLGAGVNTDGESLDAAMDGSVYVAAKAGRRLDNIGVGLRAEAGGVYIYGGASLNLGGPGAQAAPAPGGGRASAPSVLIEAGTVLQLKAGRGIVFEATELTFGNLQQYNINANGSIIGQAGDTISWSSKVYNHTTTGQAVYTYSGPKDSDSSAGPLRITKFTGSPATGFTGGVADEYTLEFGDRSETIKMGDHTTEVQVGDATYKVGTGKLLMQAEQSSIEMSRTGIDGKAQDSGSAIKFVASSGAATFEAQTTTTIKGASINIKGDNITFSTASGGSHPPPGGQSNGGLMTDGVLNPLTGVPFSQTGTLGIPTIRVS